MSIDLNKKYVLTGNQLTSLKTYIDSHGGGGGEEILCGPGEPDDSLGENGQLYVVIPELSEDDFGNFILRYQYPTGKKAQLSLQTDFMTASRALFPDGSVQLYRQGTYWLARSWSMEEAPNIYTNGSLICQQITYELGNYGINGSITYDSNSQTYTVTIDGTATSGLNWNQAMNALSNAGFWDTYNYNFVGYDKYMSFEFYIEEWGSSYSTYRAFDTLDAMAIKYDFTYSTNPEGIYCPSEVSTDTNIHTEEYTSGEELKARLATIKSETIATTPLNLEIIKQ